MRFIELKSLSVGNLKEKHVIMLGCLCKALLKEEGATHSQKWRNLKLERSSPSYGTVQKWAAKFKRGRESVTDDGRSGGPKDATADENVKVVQTLSYV